MSLCFLDVYEAASSQEYIYAGITLYLGTGRGLLRNERRQIPVLAGYNEAVASQSGVS